MQVQFFEDKVLLQDKRDVLRVHLYFKLLQFGIRPYESDMDIILELYQFGGYTNSEQQASFIKACIDKKYKKSDQSVRNTLSKYVSMGVLEKPRNTQLFINDRFILPTKGDKVILKHLISHAE